MNESLLLSRIALLEKECRALRAEMAAFLQDEAIGDIKTVAGIVPLAEVEKAAILRAMAVTGNPTASAKLLGIGKTTVYRMLKKYGVPAPRYASKPAP